MPQAEPVFIAVPLNHNEKEIGGSIFGLLKSSNCVIHVIRARKAIPLYYSSLRPLNPIMTKRHQFSLFDQDGLFLESKGRSTIRRVGRSESPPQRFGPKLCLSPPAPLNTLCYLTGANSSEAGERIDFSIGS